jgi:hypothetical protein
MSITLDGTNGINTPNNFAFKNLLINAGFTINQRAYVSAAILATTVYAHDRWKAGAAGGDYSFTQLNSVTGITIVAGKTLIQVVEDKNVNGTSFVLSWTGTAQARYAVNSNTPAGSYAASPIVITGQTAGTTMSVEFNNGTLSKPQLELGAVPTSFDQRAYGTELALCQRYYEIIKGGISGYAAATTTARCGYQFKATKRASVSLDKQVTGTIFVNNFNGNPLVTGYALGGGASVESLQIDFTVASGFTAGQGVCVYALDLLSVSAEL